MLLLIRQSSHPIYVVITGVCGTQSPLYHITHTLIAVMTGVCGIQSPYIISYVPLLYGVALSSFASRV